MEKIFKIGATIILFASIITPTAAIAEGSTLGDSVATYKEVAPNLFAQTELDNTVEVVEDPIDQTVTIEDDRTVTTSDNVSISFSGNGQEALESNGIVAYDDSSRASSQLIQPLSAGFRVIRILENSQASEDYTYEISIPKGAVLEPVFGSIRVVRGDEIIGSLKTPWALDALGNELPTSYALDGNRVTQHIDVTEDTVFPVVADPAWGYVYTFSLVHTPSSDWNKLHRCFNCYFPVTGAPKSWPPAGKYYPCELESLTPSSWNVKWDLLALRPPITGGNLTRPKITSMDPVLTLFFNWPIAARVDRNLR